MAVQYVVPTTQGATTGWSVTGGSGNHWDAVNNGINSGTPSLLDYVESTASNSGLVLAFASGSTLPGTNTGFKLHLTLDGIDDPTVVVNFQVFEDLILSVPVGPALNITQLTGGLGTTVSREYVAHQIAAFDTPTFFIVRLWVPPSSPAQQVRIYEVEFEIPDAAAAMPLGAGPVVISTPSSSGHDLTQLQAVDMSVGSTRIQPVVLPPTSLVIDAPPPANVPPFRVERVEVSSPRVVA